MEPDTTLEQAVAKIAYLATTVGLTEEPSELQRRTDAARTRPLSVSRVEVIRCGALDGRCLRDAVWCSGHRLLSIHQKVPRS